MFGNNVGGLDRAVRIVLGLVILALFFLYPQSEWRYWALVGLIPLVTGLVGTCPLYSIFGISTCAGRRA